MTDEHGRTAFNGRLVERRSLGTREFAYLEAADGRRQLAFFCIGNVGDDAYEEYLDCELGANLLIVGETYWTKKPRVHTIRVRELDVLGRYHGKNHRSDDRRYPSDSG